MLPVVKRPRTVFHESFVFEPEKTRVKSFPSALVHLFEKFQKNVLPSIFGEPHPLVNRTVVHGPHGVGAS